MLAKEKIFAEKDLSAYFLSEVPTNLLLAHLMLFPRFRSGSSSARLAAQRTYLQIPPARVASRDVLRQGATGKQ
jgi:hypothetical protein